MKTATITSTMDLTHGGCNACGPVESLLYSLEIDQQTIAVEELRVSSLVMAIVLHEGWRQEFKVEMIDEYMLYQKGDKEVKLIEDYNALTYTSVGETLSLADNYTEQETLFSQVNRVLTTFFALESFNFIW